MTPRLKETDKAIEKVALDLWKAMDEYEQDEKLASSTKKGKN